MELLLQYLRARKEETPDKINSLIEKMKEIETAKNLSKLTKILASVIIVRLEIKLKKNVH